MVLFLEDINPRKVGRDLRMGGRLAGVAVVVAAPNEQDSHEDRHAGQLVETLGDLLTGVAIVPPPPSADEN